MLARIAMASPDKEGRYGLNQARHANDRDHALYVVGQHVQRHLGADVLELSEI
jgi:hypothetical protein